MYLKVPKRMTLDEKEIESLGVKTSSDLALLLKSHCMDLSRMVGCGENYLTPSCDSVVSSNA